MSTARGRSGIGGRLGRRVNEWGAFCAVGIVGIVLGLVTTRHGVGIGTDSSAYLGGAHNLLDGRGLTTPFTILGVYGPRRAAGFGGAVPLTHFAPLFPVTVAGLAAFGISVASASRVLNIALFGVNLVLVGLLARRVTASRIVSVAVMLLVLAGPVFGSGLGAHPSWLYLHSIALSEPLFITCSLLALLMLSRYLRGGRIQDLVGVSAFAGLALLTRYVGISVVIAAVVAIALWAGGVRAGTRRGRLGYVQRRLASYLSKPCRAGARRLRAFAHNAARCL